MVLCNKKYHSTLLQALADGNYELIWVDNGGNGACSDSQIWNTCNLKGHILDKTADLPGPSTLHR